MKIRIFSGNISSKTAGLSPYDDKRVELFLAGCRMAREGHPCPGCFNSQLWSDKGGREQDIEEVIQYIESMTDNKFITIVGGEPLDQYQSLIELMKQLQKKQFHVVLFSHYTMAVIENMYPNVLEYTNLLVDGVYQKDKRIFDTDSRPGIFHVVGSSNQKIWFKNGYNFKDVTKEDDLRYYYETRR